MIGLDTNVVVRLLVQDDPKQLRKAQKVVAEQCSEDNPGLINCVVLVEVVWVLSSFYQYSRQEIASAIKTLLQVKELAIQHPSEAWEALHLYCDQTADFADYFIALINKANECETTLTFDKKAARNELFKLL